MNTFAIPLNPLQQSLTVQQWLRAHDVMRTDDPIEDGIEVISYQNEDHFTMWKVIFSVKDMTVKALASHLVFGMLYNRFNWSADRAERFQQEAGEEGTPDISFATIQQKDGEGKEINYHGLDIHHMLANHTVWQDLDLTRLQAPHASLLGVLFAYSNLDTASLDQADMRNASIKNCWMPDASFLQAQLQGVAIADTNLSYTNVGASQMNKGHIQYCKAIEAVFKGAQCREMSFLVCNLQRADFQHANLTDALLVDCDLTAANLSHANLTNAVFESDCLFTQVDLAYADLTGMCITLEQLRSANLLHIWQAFEKICQIRSRGAVITYRDYCMRKGEVDSLPTFLGMQLVPNGPAHCIEQFSHGLLPKKNEHGDIDGRYSDVPVRTILLEWINAWLSE